MKNNHKFNKLAYYKILNSKEKLSKLCLLLKNNNYISYIENQFYSISSYSTTNHIIKNTFFSFSWKVKLYRKISEVKQNKPTIISESSENDNDKLSGCVW